MQHLEKIKQALRSIYVTSEEEWAVFLIAMVAGKLRGKTKVFFSGMLAMSVMLLFTAIGHFAFPEGMSMMIPVFIPLRYELVIVTGLFELAAAIALLIPKLSVKVSWLLIAFFVIILPANIYAAFHHVNYQEATFDGPGLGYLWFRVPLQLFFIGWLYYFGIMKGRNKIPLKS